MEHDFALHQRFLPLLPGEMFLIGSVRKPEGTARGRQFGVRGWVGARWISIQQLLIPLCLRKDWSVGSQEETDAGAFGEAERKRRGEKVKSCDRCLLTSHRGLAF